MTECVLTDSVCFYVFPLCKIDKPIIVSQRDVNVDTHHAHEHTYTTEWAGQALLMSP